MDHLYIKRVTARYSGNEGIKNYAECYDLHTSLCEGHIPTTKSTEWGDFMQVASNTRVVQQALLHRAIRLFESAIFSVEHENLYSMVLSIRGHFETTAALGYLHYRLGLVNEGKLDLAVYHRDVASQVLSTRDDSLLTRMKDSGEEVLEAKNILSMLKHADKVTSKNFFENQPPKNDPLTDCYTWLSEFCHPNYHSMSVAIDVDRAGPSFRIRHEQPMRDREADILEYILVSGSIFVFLFAQISDIATALFAKENK